MKKSLQARHPAHPTAGGGIYATIEPHRVIVTYDAVPVYTSGGNGAPNTMQVVINDSGLIEMTYGVVTNNGADYGPIYIGMVGVTNGLSDATELLSDQVNFSSIKRPVTLPSAYEVFHLGIGNRCSGVDE